MIELIDVDHEERLVEIQLLRQPIPRCENTLTYWIPNIENLFLRDTSAQ